ncbi:MAG: hypothetical protein ACTHON_17530 [Humibacter sp.]
MSTEVKAAPTTDKGVSAPQRANSVFGPVHPQDWTGGLNWSPPYPNSGSKSSGGGVPLGPDLDWRSFDGRTLDDGDQIVLSTQQTNNSFVTINLITPSTITWWKDIEIQDWTGAIIAAAWTSDRLHNASAAIPNSVISNAQMHFKKAAFFGIHTEVYTIDNMFGTGGYVLNFEWRKDA